MKDAQLGMSAGIKSKLDDAVMNDELDNLLTQKLKTISNGKSAVKFEAFNQIHRQSWETRQSGEGPGTRPHSKLETTSQPSDYKQNKILNTDLQHEQAPDEGDARMTSLAKALLQNSMKNRLLVMIEEKAEEAKAKTAQRAKPEDFKVAYPEYYEILSKYSDSRLFRAESADRLNGTLSLNAVD